MTWQSPINIPHGVIHGTPDVDTNGNLFIGGEDLFDDHVLVHSLQ